ncbi:entericidin EcnA/B family protein [Profundibacter amoris]|uniref:Entericidin EcnA/B family protein n=1 Tax=Profundibacter amoris TaxID=2171755 RepID=A0A347UGB2_9RHOB|nr:entericidin EcnA/B family protein [Profundibacter amoris]AXX97890.1 entericidin EcnA/B family protein [Profundibacter amoris]
MTKTILLITLLAFSGCATVEGLGRDILAGARKVNNAL